MTSPLTELQAFGQAFDADECPIGSCQRHQRCMYVPCRHPASDIDTCATCGEILCDHSDADYRGWSDPDAGLAPVGGE